MPKAVQTLGQYEETVISTMPVPSECGCGRGKDRTHGLAEHTSKHSRTPSSNRL